MKAVLLIVALLLAVQAQLIKHNAWKVSSCQKGGKFDLRKILGGSKGSTLIFQGSNLLTVVLLHSSIHQYQYFTGRAANVIMKIDFGQIYPEHFGKVEGKFNISLQTGGKKWWGMRYLSYSERKMMVRLRGWQLQVQMEGAAYIRLILFNICLTGVNILLLTVLVKRKRWSQIQPCFIMVLFGWQARQLLIFWFQCSFFFGNSDNCTYVTIMKYLLIIFTVKSLKIFAEVIHISNNILKNIKVTISLATVVTVLIVFLPMNALHLLIPASFYLQFRKYSQYSRLDFEVHYALINLNLFLNAQLFHKLLTHHSSLSPFTVFLTAYSIICLTAGIIMGELYQYSPQNNKNSPCIDADFDNKRYCPECLDQLYEEEGHDGSKSKERHDLSYDLWKFGVAECGHVFHIQCLKKLMRLQRGCPLIPQEDSSRIDQLNIDIEQAEISKMH